MNNNGHGYRKYIQNAVYYCQYLVIRLSACLLRLLSLQTASKFSGWVARKIGPLTKQHKIALHNLAQAFPDFSAQKKAEIVNDMWDNLGRTAVEFLWFGSKELNDNIAITGYDKMHHNSNAIYISAHMANWELAGLSAYLLNVPIHFVYRSANNHYIDRYIKRIRKPIMPNIYAKNSKSALKLIRAIKNKEAIGMMVDQKYNEGMDVPFFGRPAKTTTEVIELALRYNLPIYPVQIVRRKDDSDKEISFNVHFYNKLEYEQIIPQNIDGEAHFSDWDRDSQQQQIYNVLRAIHHNLENWITEHPEQWFWVHQRWGKIRV